MNTNNKGNIYHDVFNVILCNNEYRQINDPKSIIGILRDLVYGFEAEDKMSVFEKFVSCGAYFDINKINTITSNDSITKVYNNSIKLCTDNNISQDEAECLCTAAISAIRPDWKEYNGTKATQSSETQSIDHTIAKSRTSTKYTTNYTIKYYFDGVENDSYRTSHSAYIGEIINNAPIHSCPGYERTSIENYPLAVMASGNEIIVHLKKIKKNSLVIPIVIVITLIITGLLIWNSSKNQPSNSFATNDKSTSVSTSKQTAVQIDTVFSDDQKWGVKIGNDVINYGSSANDIDRILKKYGIEAKSIENGKYLYDVRNINIKYSELDFNVDTILLYSSEGDNWITFYGKDHFFSNNVQEIKQEYFDLIHYINDHWGVFDYYVYYYENDSGIKYYVEDDLGEIVDNLVNAYNHSKEEKYHYCSIYFHTIDVSLSISSGYYYFGVRQMLSNN